MTLSIQMLFILVISLQIHTSFHSPGPAGVRVPGDVILGGLFPVHEKSEVAGQPCSTQLYDRGLQRVEAMLFAVDRINNDTDLLPGITLGAHILDTCSRDTYALNQSLEFIRSSLSNLDFRNQFECPRGGRPVYKFKDSSGPVLGVIGGHYSSVSLQVANLLRLFRIPQISPASTAKALSDKTRFELFARTVPPDTFQALALVDIVALFNWTYVSTIASEGSYGESGIEVFTLEAAKRNICIAVQEKVPSSADQTKFQEIIANLLVKSARAVVIFARADDARGLLAAAKALGKENEFYWLASDGWGKQQQVIKGYEEVAAGAITVELESKRIDAFDQYIYDLKPDSNNRNPWFEEYWERLTGCERQHNTDDEAQNQRVYCSNRESIRSSKIYEQDSKIQFVIDAVYAFAIALQNMKEELCPHEPGVCPAMKAVDGGEFYKRYLLKTSFTDMANSIVRFDEKGDGLARYTIYNYQKKIGGAGYDYKVIGKWFKTLEMEASDVMWGTSLGTFGGGDEGQFLPTSRCSEPCGKGEAKKMTEGETCCWVCNPCMSHEYLLDEFNCKDCGKGRWPYPNKTACFDIEVKHMSWMSPFAIIPIVLSVIGIVLTVFTILVLLKHKDTPLVRASGRELSNILLGGVLLCYLNTFFLLAKPGIVICTIQRFGVGIGFSVVYGALLTKTNRIFRIFQSAAKSAARPSLISPHSQMLITLSIVSVQLGATVVWCFVHHPGIKYDYPDRDQVILKCNINDSSFVISQVYNMFLITVCTVYAIKTRKVPENFNETKFIGFTMYTTCIIWLAFIPLYFGTGNSFEIQITTLCVSISLSAYVTLICLYSPKLYIILLHPEKNVRRLTMNTAKFGKNHQPVAQTQSNPIRPRDKDADGFNIVSGKSQYYDAIKRETGLKPDDEELQPLKSADIATVAPHTGKSTTNKISFKEGSKGGSDEKMNNIPRNGELGRPKTNKDTNMEVAVQINDTGSQSAAAELEVEKNGNTAEQPKSAEPAVSGLANGDATDPEAHGGGASENNRRSSARSTITAAVVNHAKSTTGGGDAEPHEDAADDVDDNGVTSEPEKPEVGGINVNGGLKDSSPMKSKTGKRSMRNGQVVSISAGNSPATFHRLQSPRLPQHRLCQDEFTEGTASCSSLTTSDYILGEDEIGEEDAEDEEEDFDCPLGSDMDGDDDNMSVSESDIEKQDSIQGCSRHRDGFAASDGTKCAQSSAQSKDKKETNKRIITLVNAKFETVPLGLSQDIPDILL